ncbi:hypothetical protein P43SY_003281 [Pythium insidiosum]|uniref:Major facilitator superfamily (MFS) profile domain-containing protein n=1 Tax=Pythium insidiosum TaxID=114742 RepID=A0AAD5LDL4_PYTIN|nr:hypothetical protein P43SY_003281 [Pythium insidiosum]
MTPTDSSFHVHSTAAFPSTWPIYASASLALLQSMNFGWSLSQLNYSAFHAPDDCAETSPSAACLMFPGHSASQWTLAVNAWVVGGMLGSLASGALADAVGRRRTFQLNAVVMVVAAAVQSLSSSVELFSLGRWLAGLASGAATAMPSSYINEIAPPHLRSHLGVDFEVSISIDFPLDLVSPAVSPRSTTSAIALLLFAAAYGWQPQLDVSLEGVLQLSGINVEVLCSSSLFKDAGIDDDRVGSLIVNVVNLLPSFVAGTLATRFGNRTMILLDQCVMLLSAVGLTVALLVDVALLSIVFTSLYVAGFSVSLGPLAFPVASEIFPDVLRATGASLTLCVNWS